MDKFDVFNGADGHTEDIGADARSTSLEFEISETAVEESGPVFTVDADITPTASTVKVEVVQDGKEETKETAKETVEEFSIPESFDSNEQYNMQSFVETPSSIRPTYLPRFTEVSETYRMQNDPRPRPKSDSPKIEDNSDADLLTDLDPTSERVENSEVEKVIVTTTTLSNPEPTDETLTVLKFSTPIDTETQDASEIFDAKVEEPVAEEIAEEPSEEISDSLSTDDAEIVEEVENTGEHKNLTIPDPDATFSVVDFAPQDDGAIEEPLGASDTDKKEKGASHSEFNSPVQRDSIKDKFLDTLMSIKVRLAGAFVLLLAMVVMDCLHYFNVDIYAGTPLSGMPHARAVIDMLFSVCIFLLAIPETVKAIKLLFKGRLTPELFSVVSLCVILANDLTVAATRVSGYVTFGVLFGLQCLVTVFAAYNRAESDFISFKLVSRNVAKNVLDRRLTRDLPRENLSLDGAIDEYNSKTARMFRTVFVSNFFKRSSESCENFVNSAMMLGISVGVSLVAGLVSFFIDGYSAVSGVQSMSMVFMLALPTFSILSHKLPCKHAFMQAGAEESAFVGESSLYECADIDVFTYEDTEIFGIEDVSIRKVHLYGKAYNTPKAMKQMYSLFSVVGGPLDFVFSSALDRKCPAAHDIVIEDNGVSGIMEDHRICAGTKEYMQSHGIAIPDDDYRTDTSVTDSTKVMYGAEDGEVYVKFFIRYSFSEEFTMLLPYLKEKKIVPLVYTRDPNITVELLRVLTLGEDIMRVMKKHVPRNVEEKTYRRVDSGIVTHGDKNNAINMVLLAKKYTLFQTSLEATELISMIVGAVLAVLIALGDMFVLPATFLAIWQIAWCAVLYVRSKLNFLPRRDSETEEEE